MREEDEIRKLRQENLRLRTELQALRAGQRSTAAMKTWFGRHVTNLFVGKGLKGAMIRLFQELPGPVTKDTMADVSSHLIWRLTRIGLFAGIIAMVPLLVMAIQTYILDIQNEKLDVQNQLILNQNRRLDQQVQLDEANRRSSYIFLMGNILDQVDEELKISRSRQLSDALIGRIVSLTQALRPYRYLENDELTFRQLSPERGQLLFALTNSLLNNDTYDKIYARANFSYADLRDANFTGAYLRGANLAKSYFSNANFTNADLAGADLSDAYLEEALFDNTNMPGIQLQGANLRNSQLVDVTMHDADLERCDLSSIFLSGNFARSNLEGIQLRNAELGAVVLDDAYFRSPRWLEGLQDANVRGFFSIEDYYRAEPLIRQVSAYRSDTVLILRAREDAYHQPMSECQKAIVELLYSAPRIRTLDREFQTRGVELRVIQLSSPQDVHTDPDAIDSTYTFRLAVRSGDTLSTQMMVRFFPISGSLTEMPLKPGRRPRPLPFDRKLLQQLPVDCLRNAPPQR